MGEKSRFLRNVALIGKITIARKNTGLNKSAPRLLTNLYNKNQIFKLHKQ